MRCWYILSDLQDQFSLVHFLDMTVIMILGFMGMAYSFYPYVVPKQTTINQTASAPANLQIILVGMCFVLPVIIGYLIFAYRVFGGKATELHYD